MYHCAGRKLVFFHWIFISVYNYQLERISIYRFQLFDCYIVFRWYSNCSLHKNAHSVVQIENKLSICCQAVYAHMGPYRSSMCCFELLDGIDWLTSSSDAASIALFRKLLLMNHFNWLHCLHPLVNWSIVCVHVVNCHFIDQISTYKKQTIPNSIEVKIIMTGVLSIMNALMCYNTQSRVWLGRWSDPFHPSMKDAF